MFSILILILHYYQHFFSFFRTGSRLNICKCTMSNRYAQTVFSEYTTALTTRHLHMSPVFFELPDVSYLPLAAVVPLFTNHTSRSSQRSTSSGSSFSLFRINRLICVVLNFSSTKLKGLNPFKPALLHMHH